ncbi:hypothetical protein M6B38_114385 [Iris pallida]|uniref:Uncharacterized protein n=1 Tax=Iris pallida TaxID=29817 RepID=A0AAX6IKL4_IRIPA|nr:hypothetical protein M6B38_114385 [Iris pallida]
MLFSKAHHPQQKAPSSPKKLKVLGRDINGYVRGMGGGVSKTEIRASATSREKARQLKNKNEAM